MKTNTISVKKSIFIVLIMGLLLLIPLKASAASPGSNLSNAGTMGLNERTSNSVNSRNPHYYKIVVSKGVILRFSLTTNASNRSANLTLRDSSGDELEYVYTSDPSNWGYQAVNLSASFTPGVYYIQIGTVSSYTVSYTFSTSVLASETANIKVGGMNNYYLSTAVPFSAGQSVMGVAYRRFDLTDWNEAQYYKFTVGTAGTFCYSLYAEFLYSNNSSLWVCMYDSSGRMIDRSWNCYISGIRGDGGQKASRSVQLNPGTYYIGVTAPDRNVKYSISTSFKSNINKKKTVRKIKITFKPNRGKVSTKTKYVIVSKKYGKLPKPKRRGYKFKGWYTKKKGGRKVTAKSIVKSSASHVLYAHWKKK